MRKILVVDDDVEIQEFLALLLKNYGYDVQTAISAEMARQIMQQWTPNLVLLDIMMPGINGYAFCQELREKYTWEKLAIIFLSALSEADLIAYALKLGGDDYVTKPFENEELLARIDKALQHLKRSETKRHIAMSAVEQVISEPLPEMESIDDKLEKYAQAIESYRKGDRFILREVRIELQQKGLLEQIQKLYSQKYNQ